MKDKVAVVTGATSGIGRAIAQRFLAEGAYIMAGSIDARGGSTTFENADDRITHVQMDVAKEAEVEDLIASALARHGRIDVMVNNAGFAGVSGSLLAIPADGVEQTQDVLFNGVLYGMKHAAKAMTRSGSGSIINIASIAGLATYINASHVYSAMKAAVIQLTKTAALELGPQGVRVNCICPGYIATPIFGKAIGLPDEKLAQSVEVTKTFFRELQPIRRAGQPQDIANAVYWLASSEASFVTGHALAVDGGASCGVGWDPTQNRFARLAAAMADADAKAPSAS